MRQRWEDAYATVEPQITAEGCHVYPFNPLLPLDVRFFRCGRYARIRSNRHDYFELLYLCSGNVVLEVRNRYLHMQTGDLFVIGSTLPHRMTEFRTPTAKFVVLYFLPELIRNGGSSAEEAEYLTPFLAQDDAFPHVIPRRTGLPRRVLDGMLQIHEELQGKDRLSWLAAKTCLKLLLIHLARYYSSYRGTEHVFARKQHAIDRLRVLFEYVDRNYAQTIRLADAARTVHMSQPAFVRLFKQVTGQSFIAYLNQFRVAKAQELLASSGKSIAEISQAVGFSDQSYFGSLFRKLVHLTPRDYRKHIDGAKGGAALGMTLVRPPRLAEKR